MARAFKPREPVTAMALFVSQLNVEPLFGVNSGRYLEKIVPHPICAGHLVKLGKLRLLPVRVVAAALEALAAVDIGTTDAIPVTVGDHQPQSPDDFLRAIGMRRSG